MGTAYTPGLTVSASAVVRKERRLSLKGEVLVSLGDEVTAETIVAGAERPGDIETVRVAEELDVDADEAIAALVISEGDELPEGELIAEYSFLFGLIRSECRARFRGTVEYISRPTGHLGLRHPASRIELPAYVPGRVAEIFEGEGVAIECRGALVQGIFGVGGETNGTLRAAAKSPGEEIGDWSLPEDCSGAVLLAGSSVSAATLRAAAERGARAVISGGILEHDLREYLGYEIGVAVTGHEDVPLTLLITEGFGPLAMADRTFELLAGLDGRACSVSGATQIRAGALRPEIIVPGNEFDVSAGAEEGGLEAELAVGTRVRLIRRPHFGRLATVTALPPAPVEIDTGATVRVLEAQVDGGAGEGGGAVTVPRANVEIIQA